MIHAPDKNKIDAELASPDGFKLNDKIEQAKTKKSKKNMYRKKKK